MPVQTPEQVKEQVVAIVCSIAERTMRELNTQVSELHLLGYHDYKRIVGNMATDVEKARDRALEELGY